MKTLIVIPARLQSTRLKRKLLLSQTGKTLIEHTYRAALASVKADHVIVAADDPEIVSAVQAFGGQAVLTDKNHTCGTDRVAEIARSEHGADCDLIVNVQGDEPELDSTAIDLLIELLETNSSAPCATLATPIRDRDLLEDPACVKVVFDSNGRAMYFSRSVIPCAREWDDAWLAQVPPVYWQHVGLYGYRRDYLLELSERPPVAVEKIESLEQLRILDAGDTILVGEIAHSARGIDTPEDYAAFVSRQTS